MSREGVEKLLQERRVRFRRKSTRFGATRVLLATITALLSCAPLPSRSAF